ncbi:type 1 fimbrial protein [Herbaspirillum lusitanum]|uniref:fimbrial protein n=1 Tax=Herbaspirillum lusitanum TaxID=213312 RepID=UPI002238FF19|nr:hypothetical protein [Herbaspirillum lusitanum]MCW5301039.1 type 1 fimbrial protein [Herbaspirillum lusitanum]
MTLEQKMKAGFRCLLLLGTMLCCTHAAVAQTCSIDTPHTAAVTFPASVSQPRNAPVGTMLTGWVAADTSDSWTCTMPINGSNFGVFTDLAISTTNRVSVGGVNYAYIATNVDGVGIIAKTTGSVTASVVGSTGNPTTFPASRNVGPSRFFNNQSQLLISLGGTTSSGTWKYVASQTVSLALVKVGSAALGAKVNAGIFGRTGVRFMSALTDAGAAVPLLYTHNITYSAVNFAEQTCSTPDVVIPLGRVPLSTFQGAGVQTSAWVNRVININNCPANMTRVKIRFNTPTSGWLDQPNQVFNLNNPGAPGTAKGIGIQMSFGGSNAIAPYDADQTMAGYDGIKSTGGSFTVPIGGRYYKPASSAVVRGGTADGAVIFDMTYE